MKHSLLTLVGALVLSASPVPAAAQQTSPAASTGSTAAGASCAMQVGEKKLAGAAKNSFMQRCERDAQASCDSRAAERKLAGAAKNSFVKKCVTDAVGAAS